MKKRNHHLATTYICLGLAFGIILGLFGAVVDGYEIVGNKVIIDDDNVYLSVDPHTITGDQTVCFNLTSKKYSGNIDVVLGINSSYFYPPKNPYIKIGNGNYNKLEKQIVHRNITFKNMTKWYILKEVNINKDVNYSLKLDLSIRFNSSGKYFFGIKRSIDPISAGYYIDPWWDNSWHYYKTITVTNKIDDYQTEIVVAKTIGGDVDCEGHCKDDFGDIRFVYNNVTQLPYYILNYTSGVQANIWVNNSGNYSNFEMFYGNAGASDVSNGTICFDFFDNFSKTSMNNSKWHEVNSVNVDWSNIGYVELSDDGYISTDKIWDANIRCYAQAWCNEQDTNFLRLMNDSDTDDRTTIINSDTYSNNVFNALNLLTFNGGVKTQSDIGGLLDIRYLRNYEIKYLSNLISYYQNRTFITIHNSNIPNDGDLNFQHQVWDSSQDSTLRVYLSFIAKYVTIEPSYSFGIEVQNITLALMSGFYPVNNTVGICPCDVVFGITVNSNNLMTITFLDNTSGGWVSFLTFENVGNGSYYGVGQSFIKFNYPYYWRVNVSTGLKNSSEIFTFNTTNNINCSEGGYSQSESDDRYVFSNLNVDPEFLFLGLWFFIFFIWWRSESEDMTDYMAILFLPYTIFLCVVILPSYIAEIESEWRWLTHAIFLIIGIIVTVYSWEVRKRRKK